MANDPNRCDATTYSDDGTRVLQCDKSEKVEPGHTDHAAYDTVTGRVKSWSTRSSR